MYSPRDSVKILLRSTSVTKGSLDKEVNVNVVNVSNDPVPKKKSKT